MHDPSRIYWRTIFLFEFTANQMLESKVPRDKWPPCPNLIRRKKKRQKKNWFVCSSPSHHWFPFKAPPHPYKRFSSTLERSVHIPICVLGGFNNRYVVWWSRTRRCMCLKKWMTRNRVDELIAFEWMRRKETKVKPTAATLEQFC